MCFLLLRIDLDLLFKNFFLKFFFQGTMFGYRENMMEAERENIVEAGRGRNEILVVILGQGWEDISHPDLGLENVHIF